MLSIASVCRMAIEGKPTPFVGDILTANSPAPLLSFILATPQNQVMTDWAQLRPIDADSEGAQLWHFRCRLKKWPG